MTILYKFALVDDDQNLVVTTHIEEPNPVIDHDFWMTFMSGEFSMVFIGTELEDEE